MQVRENLVVRTLPMSLTDYGNCEAGSLRRPNRGDTVTDVSARREDRIQDCLIRLAADFPRYVMAYDVSVPFTSEQLAAHRETIGLRRQLGSVRAAIDTPQFVVSLRRTLTKWGLGIRGSKLVSEAAFAEALSAAVPALEPLESLRIDAHDLPGDDISERLWQLISSLGVVENKSKLVAGTKTLHHLLPELVVPMDQKWTGQFFQLHPPEWTEPANQRRTFRRVYQHFIHLAQQVEPEQHVTGQAWRTSRTKVIDNALIGYCKVEQP